MEHIDLETSFTIYNKPQSFGLLLVALLKNKILKKINRNIILYTKIEN